MLPLLRDQRFDEALLVALAGVDAAATGERAGQLQLARQVDAVVGIVGGLGGFLLLSAYAFFHWRRYGRDPYVVDSRSIYLPAPPAELTAAGGALLHDGSSSRRTLTTALLDLASRDELAFRAEDQLIGADEVTVEIRRPDVDDPRVRLNRRNPLSPAEAYASASWWRRVQLAPTTRGCSTRRRCSSSEPPFGDSTNAWRPSLSSAAGSRRRPAR